MLLRECTSSFLSFECVKPVIKTKLFKTESHECNFKVVEKLFHCFHLNASIFSNYSWTQNQYIMSGEHAYRTKFSKCSSLLCLTSSSNPVHRTIAADTSRQTYRLDFWRLNCSRVDYKLTSSNAQLSDLLVPCNEGEMDDIYKCLLSEMIELANRTPSKTLKKRPNVLKRNKTFVLLFVS